MQKKIRHNEIFQDESGSMLRLPDYFSFTQSVFTEYKHCVIDDRHVIIGSKPSAITDVICRDGNLLFSLLSLSASLSPLDEFYIKREHGDAGSYTLVLASVLSWCKKWGMPFQGYTTFCGLENSMELFDKNRLWGFGLDSFIEGLTNLSAIFETYLAIYHQENAEKRRLGFSSDLLKNRLSGGLDFISLRFKIVQGENISFSIHADTLFSAALYQLLLLISNPGRNGIAKCDCCKNWFQPTRKTNRFCPDCSPQKAYARRKRKRGRENA